MGWVVLAVILLIVAAAFYAYRTAFYLSPKKRGALIPLPDSHLYAQLDDQVREMVKEMEALPFEAVTITARDGVRLAGRYIHIRDGAPVQIQFHGYRGSAKRDFCGGNKLARELGHNTLVVDHRAHGDSGDTTIAFGVRERLDCLCWVEYAAQRFGPDTPITLAGVSMGAATVLMAAEFPLPPNVVGIIADSPYTSPAAIIKRVCREDHHLPPALAYPFVQLGAFLFGRGLRLSHGSAVEAVKNAKVPILLIHGEADSFVPREMSDEIDAACAAPKRLETFPGAGHGISYMADTERYCRVVQEFLDECFAMQKSL